MTYLARYLRGGPIKNARLVAWDGDRVTFTYRARHEEADGARPGPQRMTLPVADFLQRWLLHVPVPQTRVVRSYGLYHPAHAEALAVCRAALGQPPVEAPARLDWQTVCAQRGEAHPERCPTCGQMLVCTGVIPRGGCAPAGTGWGARGMRPTHDRRRGRSARGWCVWRWPGGVPPWQGRGLGGLSGPGLGLLPRRGGGQGLWQAGWRGGDAAQTP